MARLGRQRRESARITRARSTTTPTPLVRKRLVQTPVANDRANIVARAWRRRRSHFIFRAPLFVQRRRQPQPIVSRAGWRASIRGRSYQPRGARLTRNVSTPTATPLVRKRLVLEPNGANSAWRWYAHVGRGRRKGATILRAPVVALGWVRPRPVVHPDAANGAWRWYARLERSRRRGAIILRAPIAAALPWTRTRIVVHPDGNSAGRVAARLGRGRRARATVLRAPSTPTATPLVRRRVVVETTVVSRTRAVARTRRRKPILLRAALPVATQARPRPVVTSTRRRPIARLRRHDAIILRAPIAPLATSTRRAPVVTHIAPRRTKTVRMRQRHPVMIRGRSLATATPLVRRRLVLETQTGNRSRLVARTRHRNHAYVFGLAPLGYLASGVRLTASFDPPAVNQRLASSPSSPGFDPSHPTDGRSDSPVAVTYDPPNPRQT
jgi:hypothetical protein